MAATMAGFFNDRRGISGVDYLFVAVLAYAVRDLALTYGEAAGLIIRHGLRMG